MRAVSLFFGEKIERLWIEGISKFSFQRFLVILFMDGMVMKLDFVLKSANGKQCPYRYEPGQFYQPHYDYFSDEVRFLFYVDMFRLCLCSIDIF
jgi:hypothetical protein